MESYPKRITHFFLQSIHTLKKESGGQRWNEICENTVENAFTYFPSFPFSKDELWKLFFYPPQTIQDSLILSFFQREETSPKFLFLLLESLTDPPKPILSCPLES